MTSLEWLTDDNGELLTTDDGALLSTDTDLFFTSTPRTAAAYRIDVCNNFQRVGVADTFTFAGVNRRNEIGEWQAVIPEGGVTFNGDATIADVDSIIVWDVSTKPATITAAGSITPHGSVTTGIKTTTGLNGVRWTLTGVDLFGLLTTRLAYPDPSSESPWTDDYDQRSGAPSSVAAGYIEANIGVNALANRQIGGVSVVDSGVGVPVTWTARLQPLSTLVTSICNAAGIVCRATMPAPGQVVYTLTVGADRTGQTIISDHDVSGNITVDHASARSTFVVAGGAGELTNRVFETAQTAATGIDRVESFYDVATLTGVSAVALAAQGSLIEASAEVAVNFGTLLPDRWRYGVDFDIGDIISVEVGGVRYSELVDAVAFTITPSRSSIRPLLGRTTSNEAEQIMRTVWGTVSRFNQNIR